MPNDARGAKKNIYIDCPRAVWWQIVRSFRLCRGGVEKP